MPDVFDDPVVAEVHAVRAAMIDAADGDIRELMRQVVERQQGSKHRIITRPLRQRIGQAIAVELRNDDGRRREG